VDSTDQGKAVHIYDGMESSRTADAADPTQATVIPLAPDAADTTPPAAAASDGPAAPREPDPATGAGDAAPAMEENADQASTTEPPHILDGTFTLRRGRFLHVDVDLGYTKTVTVTQPATTTESNSEDSAGTTEAAPQTTSIYVRMTDSRRVRDESLHYLDHPLFGVLFMVTPYQAPGTDDSAEQ
jgi:hypothetical protein